MTSWKLAASKSTTESETESLGKTYRRKRHQISRVKKHFTVTYSTRVLFWHHRFSALTIFSQRSFGLNSFQQLVGNQNWQDTKLIRYTIEGGSTIPAKVLPFLCSHIWPTKKYKGWSALKGPAFRNELVRNKHLGPLPRATGQPSGKSFFSILILSKAVRLPEEKGPKVLEDSDRHLLTTNGAWRSMSINFPGRDPGSIWPKLPCFLQGIRPWSKFQICPKSQTQDHI